MSTAPRASTAKKRTRCRSTSLYLSPSRKVSLRNARVYAMLGDERRRITDRRQIAELMKTYGWDGTTEIVTNAGVERVVLDPRIVNGHLPSNASWWRMRQLMDGADLTEVGGPRQLAEVLFGVSHKPLGNAAATAIRTGRGFHVSVLSATAPLLGLTPDELAAVLAAAADSPMATWWRPEDPAELAALHDVLAQIPRQHRLGVVQEFFAHLPAGATEALVSTPPWVGSDALAAAVVAECPWEVVLAFADARTDAGLPCDFTAALRARSAVGACADGDLDALRAVMAMGDTALREQAADAFLSSCVSALISEVPMTRRVALSSLRVLGDYRPDLVAGALEAALVDPDPAVRAEAVRALLVVPVDHPDLGAWVDQALADPDAKVAAEAWLSLPRLNGRRAATALERLEGYVPTREPPDKRDDMDRAFERWLVAHSLPLSPCQAAVTAVVSLAGVESGLVVDVFGRALADRGALGAEACDQFAQLAEVHPNVAAAALISALSSTTDPPASLAALDATLAQLAATTPAAAPDLVKVALATKDTGLHVTGWQALAEMTVTHPQDARRVLDDIRDVPGFWWTAEWPQAGLVVERLATSDPRYVAELIAADLKSSEPCRDLIAAGFGVYFDAQPRAAKRLLRNYVSGAQDQAKLVMDALPQLATRDPALTYALARRGLEHPDPGVGSLALGAVPALAPHDPVAARQLIDDATDCDFPYDAQAAMYCQLGTVAPDLLAGVLSDVVEHEAFIGEHPAMAAVPMLVTHDPALGAAVLHNLVASGQRSALAAVAESEAVPLLAREDHTLAIPLLQAMAATRPAVTWHMWEALPAMASQDPTAVLALVEQLFDSPEATAWSPARQAAIALANDGVDVEHLVARLVAEDATNPAGTRLLVEFATHFPDKARPYVEAALRHSNQTVAEGGISALRTLVQVDPERTEELLAPVLAADFWETPWVGRVNDAMLGIVSQATGAQGPGAAAVLRTALTHRRVGVRHHARETVRDIVTFGDPTVLRNVDDVVAFIDDPEALIGLAAAGVPSANPAVGAFIASLRSSRSDPIAAAELAAATSLGEVLAAGERFDPDEATLDRFDGRRVSTEVRQKVTQVMKADPGELTVRVIRSKAELLRNRKVMRNCTDGLVGPLSRGDVLLAVCGGDGLPLYNVQLEPSPSGWQVRQTNSRGNAGGDECKDVQSWVEKLLKGLPAPAPAEG